MSAAKALALATGLPYVRVNHLEAHLYAAWLEEPDLEPPLAVLIVSGGHTLLVVMEDHGRYRMSGQTVDDAAGEAFDKVARFLGLGYPGGPAIDRLAAEGDPAAVAFPRAMLGEGYDFSFSGLKTAVVNHVRKHSDVATRRRRRFVPGGRRRRADDQAPRRSRRGGAPTLVLGGGVAANSRLRSRVAEAARRSGRPGVPPAPGVVHRQRRHDRRPPPGGGSGPTARRRSTPASPPRSPSRRSPRSASADDPLRPHPRTSCVTVRYE